MLYIYIVHMVQRSTDIRRFNSLFHCICYKETDRQIVIVESGYSLHEDINCMRTGSMASNSLLCAQELILIMVI